MNRRNFLKATAGTTASLFLSTKLSGLPLPTMAAAHAQIEVELPSFDPMPEPTVFGNPADVAVGWDGVQWALHENGAASTYDPVGTRWIPFGTKLDAVAAVPNGAADSYYFLRGNQFFSAKDVAPKLIQDEWPGLPASFQTGVDGAASCGAASDAALYLFRNGLCVRVDQPDQPFALTALSSWPSSSTIWQTGAVDMVASGSGGNEAILIRHGEYLVVDLVQRAVTQGPAALSALFSAPLQAAIEEGVQSILFTGPVLADATPLYLFQGPVAFSFASAASSQAGEAVYLSSTFALPAVWYPRMRQAPNGQLGDLWTVARLNSTVLAIFNHDGTSWNFVPLPNNDVPQWVAAGADGSVYAISAATLYRLQNDKTAWAVVAPTTDQPFAQVAVGDDTHVWVLDTGGKIFNLFQSALYPESFDGAASHIAANPDGTLWHTKSGSSSVYRYISEGSAPPESLTVAPDVTLVQKAAATRYGAGLVLAQRNGQPQLYTYHSPYVFKTGTSYDTFFWSEIALGSGLLYLAVRINDSQDALVALDMHEGVEVARWQPSDAGWSFSNWQMTAPVYDVNNKVVYVGLTPSNGGLADYPLVALDAVTLQQRWSYTVPGGLFARPALAGHLLCFGDRNGLIYLLDTVAPLNEAEPQSAITPLWTHQGRTGTFTFVATPHIAAGYVYTVAAAFPEGIYVQRLELGSGSLAGEALALDKVLADFSPAAPLWVELEDANGAPTNALVVNNGQEVLATTFDATNPWPWRFSPGPNNFVTSALSYSAGTLWVGGDAGLLYGLDKQLKLLPNLPAQAKGDGASGIVYTTPVVVQDQTGGSFVFFGSWDEDLNDLYLYDVNNNVVESIDTGLTPISILSPTISNRTIYATGWNTEGPAQVFAIRVDQAIRTARDFIIESQLMQDYDEVDGSVTSIARYQTNLTIVDDIKLPQAYMGVKIWTDTATTLYVGGQPYTVGPDQPLNTSVDVQGTLTIVSDADDLFAPTLRVWASFMDPQERVVAYPDAEFHQRLTATTADAGSDQLNQINLSTTVNYSGQPLFTDQTAAQNTADAVRQISQSITGGGATAAAATLQQALFTRQTGADQPFVPYDDLPGMHYFPFDTPANRAARTPLAFGLSLEERLTPLSVAEATLAIDSMEGVDGLDLVGGIGNWFKDIWAKIKSGVAKIAKAVASVAKNIYLGLQYIENGIVHVVRHIIQDVEDVAAAVGSFFVKLGKEIENVVQALGIFLHFDEVIKTHAWLSQQILGQKDNAVAWLKGAQSAVDNFFVTAEQGVAKEFCTLKQEIEPGYSCDERYTYRVGGGQTSVTDWGKTDTTEHTLYTIQPTGGGQSQSAAVQCTWAGHKAKQHYQAATPAQGAAATGDDALTDFLSNFLTSLTSDPTLQNALASTKQDFSNAFKAQSANDFFKMAAVGLLDLIEDVALAGLDVVKAFFDGVFDVADDLFARLFDPESGIATRPLNIPVLSALYLKLIGSPLTILDLMLLIAAIPITVIYKIVEGRWPSQDLNEAQASTLGSAASVLIGLSEAVLRWAIGIFVAISAATSVSEDNPAPTQQNLAQLTTVAAAAFLVLVGIKTFAQSPTALDDVSWALGAGLLLITGLAAFLPPKKLEGGRALILPILASIFGLVRMIVFIVQAVEEKPPGSITAARVMFTTPAMLQFLKLTGETTKAILAIAAAVCNLGAGIAILIEALEPSATPPAAIDDDPVPAPQPALDHHLFFPIAGN